MGINDTVENVETGHVVTGIPMEYSMWFDVFVLVHLAGYHW